MYKAYKFRLYPNKNQQILINKTMGCVGFIYNHFLEKCMNTGYMKAYDMCSEIKILCNVYPWLKEVDSCSLRCSVFNLEDAYKNYFSKRSDAPKFKAKNNRESYRTSCIRSEYKGKIYQNIEVDLKNKKIKLPKLGLVDTRGYRNINDFNKKIINATVTKENTGKYYVWC